MGSHTNFVTLHLYLGVAQRSQMFVCILQAVLLVCQCFKMIRPRLTCPNLETLICAFTFHYLSEELFLYFLVSEDSIERLTECNTIIGLWLLWSLASDLGFFNRRTTWPILKILGKVPDEKDMLIAYDNAEANTTAQRLITVVGIMSVGEFLHLFPLMTLATSSGVVSVKLSRTCAGLAMRLRCTDPYEISSNWIFARIVWSFPIKNCLKLKHSDSTLSVICCLPQRCNKSFNIRQTSLWSLPAQVNFSWIASRLLCVWHQADECLVTSTTSAPRKSWANWKCSTPPVTTIAPRRPRCHLDLTFLDFDLAQKRNYKFGYSGLDLI